VLTIVSCQEKLMVLWLGIVKSLEKLEVNA